MHDISHQNSKNCPIDQAPLRSITGRRDSITEYTGPALYPMEYTHSSVVLCLAGSYLSILKGFTPCVHPYYLWCFTGTGTIVWLPHRRWSNNGGCWSLIGTKLQTKNTRCQPCAYFRGWNLNWMSTLEMSSFFSDHNDQESIRDLFSKKIFLSNQYGIFNSIYPDHMQFMYCRKHFMKLVEVPSLRNASG